jgi:type IV pilus assembly protein PilY1
MPFENQNLNNHNYNYIRNLRYLRSKNMKNAIYIMLAISISGFPLLAFSDDTEIHLGNSFSDLEPNVIFIMDTSGSMGWETDSTNTPPVGEESRLDIVKRIAIETIEKTKNINISLMSFNSSGQGATLDLPLTPIGDAAQDFKQIMGNYTAIGGTPITESLDEALRYFRGDTVKYGESGVASAMNSARTQYKNPIKNQCQKNHVILFSDGEPVGDIESNSDILDKINASSDPRKSDLDSLDADQKCSGDGVKTNQLAYANSYLGDPFISGGGIVYTYAYSNDGKYYYYYEVYDKSGVCAEEIALLAQIEDFSPDSPVFQNVTIHTVGGFVGGEAREKLKSIAKFGSPLGEDSTKIVNEITVPSTYYAADSAESLASELEILFNKISDEGSTFTAPSVSVNAFNSLELSDELYYAVFKPSKQTDWAGNLKRYRLDLSDTGATIVGQNQLPAIDDETGFFKEAAVSYWSDASLPADGLEVTQGGMAQHLTLPRNIKTTKDGKLIDFSSSNFTDSELDIVGKSADHKLLLLDWAQGIDVDAGLDVNGEPIPRLSIEDPLHSEPTIITYSSSINQSTGEKTQDRTLFLGTNSGYLHAFDVSEQNPKEFFAFIPKELVHNLDKYYSGGSFYDNKAYGIDGPLTHWHDDTNDNSQVDGSEKVYLYITLRRGGQSFYALDVTNRTAPELLWEKHGNYPADFPNKPAVSSGYDKLGQTWARLEPATITLNGVQTAVLFTAGGYDPSEDGITSDGPSSRSQHDLGTTVYMIDALTGKVLWDASINSASSEMTSSFAGNVAPVDSTGDGQANIIFAADTGGRVWRFDINSSAIDATDFATTHLLADISTGTGAGNRRFFNEVDVVYREKEKDILLSIGSGYRAHPLSLVVTDYHFIVRTPVEKPTSNHLITLSDLTDWGIDSAYGWKVPLTLPGEKVLSRSSTTSGAILFTTFAPKSSNAADLCSSDPGIATLYILNNKIVRHVSLVQGGIPTVPVIVRNKNANNAGSTASSRSILIGTEVINLSKGGDGEEDESLGHGYDNMSKDYWLEKK